MFIQIRLFVDWVWDVYLHISSTDLADITVTGKVGEAVSLPCKCPPDSPPYLVWQKVAGEQTLVVNYYKDDDQEDNPTALEYRNRTELHLRGNCSLVFHSVSPSDQGLYECYYQKSPLRCERIQLLVRGQYMCIHTRKVNLICFIWHCLCSLVHLYMFSLKLFRLHSVYC